MVDSQSCVLMSVRLSICDEGWGSVPTCSSLSPRVQRSTRTLVYVYVNSAFLSFICQRCPG